MIQVASVCKLWAEMYVEGNTAVGSAQEQITVCIGLGVRDYLLVECLAQSAMLDMLGYPRLC